VTSVNVWILFEFNRKICFWILLCVVCFLPDSIFPLSIFLLWPSALLQTGPHSFFVDYVPRVFVSGVARLGPVRRSQCCQREVCFGAFLLVSVLVFSGAATDPVLVFKTHFGFSSACRIQLSATLDLCFGPGFRWSGIGMPCS
jgi:hypothetical protein